MSQDAVIQTIDPTDGSPLQEYPLMETDAAIAGVEACHKAFETWRHETPAKRAEIIRAIGQALRDHEDELSELMTREMGKLRSQSRTELQLCAAICDYTADNGPDELKTEERPYEGGVKGHVAYRPIGVIYGIQPWNFPIYQVVRYSIANLMAGNGVLLKHAESVTGCGLRLEELYREAGLPADLFKVLVIDHDQSDKVLEHDAVRGVTLTGSPGAGKIIGKKAGAVLKKTVLELGSNDAYIVLEDADLEQAVKQCVIGRTFNNGQTCVAAKRFVVVDAVFDAFKEQFVAAMKDMEMVDPMESEQGLGPMAREDLRDELHSQVQESIENGASLLCGGEIPDRDGWWYPATVLGDVAPGQPAYDDELFGPAAALIRAKDEEDAMRIANDSRFGLGGAIFSKDLDRARHLAEMHFDTGMVFINGFSAASPNMPFGGVKNSGYGREHGGFGMKEFVNVKAITILNE
nr:NAD-dependent succinate-semialdehyde dehydrogenase [Litoreibacter ponti]